MNILNATSTATAPSSVQLAKSQKGRLITAELMRKTDGLTRKDVATWRRAWQAAIDIESPSRAALYDIYTDCLVDMHLTGCVGQRKGKVLKKDFRLVSKDGKENPEASDILRTGWFTDFLSLALDARFWGHSLIQLGDPVQRPDGSPSLTGVELVPRKHVIQEYGVFTREPGDSRENGIPYREGPFAASVVEVGGPRDLGLLLNCAPSCISKRNMLAFWDMFGEIFGMPLRIAKTDSTNENERARLSRTLETMGAAGYGIFASGTEITFQETTRSDAFNVYDKRIDRCNSELSKGILMQTMTIDSGSSLSQSETHLEIFEDVIRSDSAMLAGVVNDRLLPLLTAKGFPFDGLRFAWDEARQYSPADLREEERMLMQYFEIDPQYFIDRYNIPITGARQQQREQDSFFA